MSSLPLEPVLVGSSPDHTHHHAVCWTSIFAGALATAALGLILLTLGFGLGLSSISPWSDRGVSSKSIAEGAIAWLVLSQIIAAGMGGYLSGRLRHRWGRVHLDEIHFRDTAQGLLSWALALVVTAAFLTSAASTMVGASNGPVERAHAHRMAPMTPPLGVPSALPGAADDAPVLNNAETAEAERKAAAYSALWLFIAMLGGAFSSSLLAVAGGRHRDTMFRYVP